MPNVDMTLRDYFAAEALRGLLAGSFRGDPNDHTMALAEACYNIADAMLMVRANSTNKNTAV